MGRAKKNPRHPFGRRGVFSQSELSNGRRSGGHGGAHEAADIRADDAEVVQFAVVELEQLGFGLADAMPANEGRTKIREH